MITQPEALRLADELDADSNIIGYDKHAAELRRLHAVNEELLEALRWISTVNAMDYEYQQKARAAIAKAGGAA